jgi:ribosomal protein S13
MSFKIRKILSNNFGIGNSLCRNLQLNTGLNTRSSSKFFSNRQKSLINMSFTNFLINKNLKKQINQFIFFKNRLKSYNSFKKLVVNKSFVIKHDKNIKKK